MFKVGDVVIYGSDGVCRIVETVQKNFFDVPEEYFVLRPVFDSKSTIWEFDT